MPHPLQPIRDYFLAGFRESIAGARTELDQFAIELLLELSRLEHTDYCYRLYRADIVGKKNGKTVVQETTVEEREVLGWQTAFPKAVSIDAPIVWYLLALRKAGKLTAGLSART